MFGGKFGNHMSNLKNTFGRGYAHVKNVLGHVDRGVSIAKKVYAILAPALDHYGGGGLHQHAVKAIGGYEHIRNKVMDGHQATQKVVGALKKAIPELGLG